MNLGNVSDKEFIELVLRAERETLTELLAQYAGQERRREIILTEIHKRQLDGLPKLPSAGYEYRLRRAASDANVPTLVQNGPH